MKLNIYDIASNLVKLIKATIPDFRAGYPYVKTDLEKGLVLSADGTKYLNFEDLDGNYFYIRTGDEIGVTNSKASTFSDCAPGIIEVYGCTLIAVMKKENNALAVKDALLSVIMSAGHKPKKQSTNSVSIIKGEAKTFAPVILARFNPYIAVKIEFDIERQFSPDTCVINLCKTC